MAAVTATHFSTKTGSYRKRVPNWKAKDNGMPRYKVGYITLPATADNGDFFTVDVYKEFGMQRVLAVVGFIQTTANSVIVEEAPVTSYDMTYLKITVGGATPNKQRTYVVYGV